MVSAALQLNVSFRIPRGPALDATLPLPIVASVVLRQFAFRCTVSQQPDSRNDHVLQTCWFESTRQGVDVSQSAAISVTLSPLAASFARLTERWGRTPELRGLDEPWESIVMQQFRSRYAGSSMASILQGA